MDRPVIRVKPKADPRRIRRGAPSVFADDLVTDRRTKALEPGAIATLEDAERVPLATVRSQTARDGVRPTGGGQDVRGPTVVTPAEVLLLVRPRGTNGRHALGSHCARSVVVPR